MTTTDLTWSRRMVVCLSACFATLALWGCSPEQAADKAGLGQEESVAREVFNRIAQRDFEAIERQVDAALQGPELRPAIERTSGFIPPGSPKQVTLAEFGVLNGPQGVVYKFTFEADYGNRWLLEQVLLKRVDATLKIVGFHVWPASASVIESHRFTLTGKGPIQWVAAALLVLVPLFVLATLVVCARTKGLRRKWLWLIFVVLGWTSLTVNWTTGQWMFNLLQVELLGAGFFQASPLTPFVVKVGIPIGALLFWWKRKRLGRAQPDLPVPTGS